MGKQGRFRHRGNYFADRPPVCTNCQIDIREHVIRRNAVGLGECSLQQRLGNLKADEIVILVGGEASLGHLHDVEAELCADVRFGILCVRYLVTKLLLKLRKLKCNDMVYRRMTGGIGSVMREGPESEGVFVKIGGLTHEGLDKVSAAHLVRKVAEVFVSERVIAHVLDHAAAVRIGVCLAEIVVTRTGEAL